MYAAFHNALQKYPLRGTDDFDVISFQNLSAYILVNNYFNMKKFDKVIARIKRCSFFSIRVHS